MKEFFVGRQRELAVLEAAYEQAGGALIPIYGRRRVGKSELILHFMQTHPGIYFLGKQAGVALQLRELLQVAAEVLQEPLLAKLSPDGWKDAIEAIVDRWKGPGKLVLALDEFQWSEAVAAELKKRATHYPNPRAASLGLRVFARGGIPDAQARRLGLRWHGLEEIYGE